MTITAEYPTLEIYAREPLVRTLARTGWHPAVLGLLFFLSISLSLTIWGAFKAKAPLPESYVTYFDNVSWSVSMLILFPILVGMTFKYYADIPELLRHLLSQTAPECSAKRKRAFWERTARRFTNPLAPTVILLSILPLNVLYFSQQVTQEAGNSWLTDGTRLSFLFGSGTGLSAMGVYAAVVQVVLIYWGLNIGWNTFVLILCLNTFFTEFADEILLEPLHPDGCCGLGKLRSASTVLSSLLFIIGLYLSLKVIDKLVVQGLPLFSDIGNPLLLSTYAIAAPVLFFLPLSAAHRVMQNRKDAFLLPIAQDYKHAVQSLGEHTKREEIERVEKLGSLYYDLQKRIPVWPFDFRSMQAFFCAVVVPVLPILLPLCVHLIKSLALK